MLVRLTHKITIMFSVFPLSDLSFPSFCFVLFFGPGVFLFFVFCFCLRFVCIFSFSPLLVRFSFFFLQFWVGLKKYVYTYSSVRRSALFMLALIFSVVQNLSTLVGYFFLLVFSFFFVFFLHFCYLFRHLFWVFLLCVCFFLQFSIFSCIKMYVCTMCVWGVVRIQYIRIVLLVLQQWVARFVDIFTRNGWHTTVVVIMISQGDRSVLLALCVLLGLLGWMSFDVVFFITINWKRSAGLVFCFCPIWYRFEWMGGMCSCVRMWRDDVDDDEGRLWWWWSGGWLSWSIRIWTGFGRFVGGVGAYQYSVRFSFCFCCIMVSPLVIYRRSVIWYDDDKENKDTWKNLVGR